ncbi:MAG: calcium-binding protein [Nostoc sp. DedQUE04]|uniref:beta strand repeat-containing protein n=1 Tax=Nostoc sp. DedQUE04 TaxID=3075390 RepID=UPI002AD475BC|nr:calcium-binding protein [Nostoc sp. DedQUE04]MDZ8138895.1 calcium-binding protein [Nostoc sp. DedQUE04]
MANINGTNGNDTLNGTTSDDLINGLAGNDKIYGNGGNDTLNGDTGDDYLSTTNDSSGANLVFGGDGNDTLFAFGFNVDSTFNGGKGNDTFYNDELGKVSNTINNLTIGGGGKDKFVYTIGENSYDTIVIADFSGIGKGLNPSAAVIAELDTLQFTGFELLTARNLQLTQNGNDLEISFEGVVGDKSVVLQNFALENLDNLAQVGNIIFYGQTSITDSFDVFNASSTQNTIFNKNTVTFLNDLSNNVDGFDNSDDVINGQKGDDIIDGLSGSDLLRGGTGNDLLIGGAGNDTLFCDTGNDTVNGGAGDDVLNVSVYSKGDHLLFGGDGNDSLFASNDYIVDNTPGNDTLNGGNGNDTFYSHFGDTNYSNTAILTTGGSGKDKFVFQSSEALYRSGSIITITDFVSIGKGLNPSAAVIAELDTLQFTGYEQLAAKNLLLTQNGNNTEISFEGLFGSKVILQNFALENLDNLAQVGNILFDGQTSITDSFDVFNANSTQSSIFNKNTVTFLNDLDNNVNGFDKSDDVINGQAGDDIIDGLSGNDLLRGDAGNDTLIGGTGDDVLSDNSDLTGNNLLSGDDGNDYLSTTSSNGYYILYDYVSGNNTLNGGAGSDTLLADISKGNNLLSGDDGNDYLSASGYYSYEGPFFKVYGNNTLNGGAGNDSLIVDYSEGDNLLSGGDGNDLLSASGTSLDYSGTKDATSSGNNTLNGGAGNDSLNINFSLGDNLLSGGNGNDFLSALIALGNNTLDGGNGNDILTSGKGNDTLYGGDGNDVFSFNSYNEGLDILYDFNATNELIQVSDAGFGGGLSTSSLKTSQFTIGTSATTSNQRFIYDFITGALYFDLDGSASGFSQVKFAQLSAGLSITENNFVVV